MISFERINFENVPWDALDKFPDRVQMQTRPWIEYIAAAQGAEPVIAAVKENSVVLGYFSGLIVKKFGLRILGSPFKGWATSYMGFNLPTGYPRAALLPAFRDFVFTGLKCHYLELIDRNLSSADCSGLPYCVQPANGYELDLSKNSNELLANMFPSCRWSIRKAQKCGLVIESASDAEFASDYYAQLRDVFDKQSLVPPHGLDRVEKLIKHIPPDNLLLLRARDNKGVCVGTAIFPAFNGVAYFWGSASLRQYQNLRPNEAIFWYAMQYWKDHGMKKIDMVGASDYKKKYGTYAITVPRLIASKYKGLIPARNIALHAHKIQQWICGRF